MRALLYKDFSASFERLLAKSKSGAIYNGNLQQLAIKDFKKEMRISPILNSQLVGHSSKQTYFTYISTYLPILHTSGSILPITQTFRQAKIWDLIPQNV